MKIKAALSSLTILVIARFLVPAAVAAADSTDLVSCSEPSELNAAACREMEEQILNSTVRITIESWVVAPDEGGYDIDHSVGHATVMDGRYLVTHNHFSVPLPDELAEGAEAYGVVYLYDIRGRRLFKGPLSDFEMAVEAGETLVFAHKEAGFFEALGLRSAEFESWTSLSLESGMEVAQVDWDGETTRVDWVQVKELIIEAGAPRLILADGVLPGASGGGIFWQGIHVANNWLLQGVVSETGAITDAVTTVALNAPAVLDR